MSDRQGWTLIARMGLQLPITPRLVKQAQQPPGRQAPLPEPAKEDIRGGIVNSSGQTVPTTVASGEIDSGPKKADTLRKPPVIVRDTFRLQAMVGTDVPLEHPEEREAFASLEINTQQLVTKAFRKPRELTIEDRVRLDREVVAAVKANDGNTYNRLKLLLRSGADKNARDPQSGYTLLMTAVSNKDYRSAGHLLFKEADPNLTDREGRHALMLASANNDAKMVRLLLNMGAVDKDGLAARWARHVGSKEIIGLLTVAHRNEQQAHQVDTGIAQEDGSSLVLKVSADDLEVTNSIRLNQGIAWQDGHSVHRIEEGDFEGAAELLPERTTRWILPTLPLGTAPDAEELQLRRHDLIGRVRLSGAFYDIFNREPAAVPGAKMVARKGRELHIWSEQATRYQFPIGHPGTKA